jgi:hypothetical protein
MSKMSERFVVTTLTDVIYADGVERNGNTLSMYSPDGSVNTVSIGEVKKIVKEQVTSEEMDVLTLA